MNNYLNGIYKFLKALAVLCSAVIMAVSFGTMAYAEGSRELNPKLNDKDDIGYRAYTEYETKKTSAGIPRTTTITVYAKQGEKIYMGTSEADSYDGNDIVLTNPVGKVFNYDVSAENGGLISTRTQELNGPDVTGNMGETYYKPVCYTATTEGFFTVVFHGHVSASPSKTRTDPEPTAVKNFAKGDNAVASVGAWDISVYNTAGTYVPGRVFTRYIALNVGNNTQPIYPKVYVLTHDGYEYQVDFNGMQPWGFILYSNNRGLVDFTNRRTLYKNAVGKDNNSMELYGNVMAPNPSLTDEGKNLTHRIFFNEPSDDLPEYIETTPQVAATFNKPVIESSVREVNGETVWSEGLTVKVNFSKVCTYTMIIDTDGNGKYDPGTDAIIRDAASQGSNEIVWDGRNDNGEIVETTGDNKLDIILYVKSGEAHLPYIDVEYNPNGIKVELVNNTASMLDENGNLVKVLDDYNPNGVYYDNRPYITANGTNINENTHSTSGTGIVKGSMPIQYAVDDGHSPSPSMSQTGVGAVDSSNGAGAYKYTYGTTDKPYGDEKIIDYWTYSRGYQYKPSEAAAKIEGTRPEGASQVKSDHVYDYVYYKASTEAGIPNTDSGVTYGYIHGLSYFDRNGNGIREQNDLALTVANDVYVKYTDQNLTENNEKWEHYTVSIADGFFNAPVILKDGVNTPYEAYLLYNDNALKVVESRLNKELESGSLKYTLSDVYVTVDTATNVATVVDKDTSGAKRAVKIEGSFTGLTPYRVYPEVGFTLADYPDAEVSITTNSKEYLLDGVDNFIEYTITITNNGSQAISDVVVESHVPMNHIIQRENGENWITYDEKYNTGVKDERGKEVTEVYYPALGQWQLSRLFAGETRILKVKAVANDAGDYTVDAVLSGYNEYAKYHSLSESTDEAALLNNEKINNNTAFTTYSIYKPLFGFTEALVTDVDSDILALGQFLEDIDGSAKDIRAKYNIYSLGFVASFNLVDLADVTVKDFSQNIKDGKITVAEFHNLFKNVFDTESANPLVDSLSAFIRRGPDNDPKNKYFGATQIQTKDAEGNLIPLNLTAITKDNPLYIQGFTRYNANAEGRDDDPSQYYIREQYVYKIYYDAESNTFKSEIAHDNGNSDISVQESGDSSGNQSGDNTDNTQSSGNTDDSNSAEDNSSAQN